MPGPTPPDPWSVDDLTGLDLRSARIVCVPDPDDTVALATALAALANSNGGDVLFGARMDEDGTVTSTWNRTHTKRESEETGPSYHDALELIDPRVDHLVRDTRTVAAPGGDVLLIHTRMSPSTPHVVTTTGMIPRMDDGGSRPLRSRRELDDLYARGRGERERADRLVDAMIEKLTLAHYAFYNMAIVACTHDPSAEPYSAAAGGALAPEGDAFADAFGLAGIEPGIRQGEVELRTPGDTGGYLRVTRSGCVAAGEIQRRPYHEELGTAGELRERIALIAAAACRLLSPAGDAVTVPHLFVEGVRGLRLVLDRGKRLTTSYAPQDTVRYALPLGDARDPEYPARLADDAISRFATLFPMPSPG
jgi:hypothetical protein